MYKAFRPILFRMDAENAHHFVLSALERLPSVGSLMTQSISRYDSLSQTLWGISFRHPIGLAAGLDKNAQAVDGFFKVGCAFVEVGTVTPKPQPGNDRPRLFRLIEDEALINRMGFNNEGAVKMLERLKNRTPFGPVGVNLGKNKWTDNDKATLDYTFLVQTLAQVADYFVINVSSPNTPGLRDLQSTRELIPLVEAVLSERDSAKVNPKTGMKIPVLVKLAPDLADEALHELAGRLCEVGIDGIIATNTTITRDGLKSSRHVETGGLSGKPLQKRSTDVVRLVRQATAGRVPIVASGGVFTAEDAYEKIRAGASLVQVYTALIYHGPAVFHSIVTGLAERLRRDGFQNITEAVASGV